jgi:hypothetical protein
VAGFHPEEDALDSSAYENVSSSLQFLHRLAASAYS